MENKSPTASQKQPTALYILALTASWERFSYYGMRAFLILYMVNAVSDRLGGIGWDTGFAGKVYGIFTGLCYLLPLLGGYLSARFFGERRSVFIGGLLIMLGHFVCAISSALPFFITGLTLLIMGNGFFKPTVAAMVGELYEQGDSRRDAGFTIYYMLFNAAVFLAPILCGYFGQTYGYRYGFVVAGIGMLLGLIMYVITAPKYLGSIGVVPKFKLRKAAEAAGQVEKKELTKEEIDRISVILVLVFFVTFFWAGYEQAGGSLNLYTDKFIDRMVGSFEIPTTWLQSVNPILVVAFGPIFSWLWVKLGKSGHNPSTPVKMGIGMLFLGLGFLCMLVAAFSRGGDNAPMTAKAGLIWLVLTYIFHTMGEMCLSPIGLSMVTKLAPERLVAMFMGVWFVSSFLANVIAGFTVGFVEQLGASTIFGGIAIFMAILGTVVFLVSRKLVVMMHGRD